MLDGRSLSNVLWSLGTSIYSHKKKHLNVSNITHKLKQKHIHFTHHHIIWHLTYDIYCNCGYCGLCCLCYILGTLQCNWHLDLSRTLQSRLLRRMGTVAAREWSDQGVGISLWGLQRMGKIERRTTIHSIMSCLHVMSLSVTTDPHNLLNPNSPSYTSWYIVSHHHIISYHLILSCLVISSNHVISCHVISSSHISSCHIISHHITSHHVLSCHVSSPGVSWEDLPLDVKSSICTAVCRRCFNMSGQAVGNTIYSLGRLGVHSIGLTDRMTIAIEVSIRRGGPRMRYRDALQVR